jgi:hypothetical protein
LREFVQLSLVTFSVLMLATLLAHKPRTMRVLSIAN